jgi:hypothetical protein
MNKVAVVVFIGIVGVLLAIIAFYQKPAKFEGITAKELSDSLAAHDKIRDQKLSILRIKYEQDSVKLTNMRSQIDQVPDLVKQINKKYDKKRDHINTLSVDEQVGHMSDWLSKDSSLGE